MSVTDPATTSSEVVSVTNLHVHFPVRQGILGRTTGFVKAVDGISFSIKRGEIFALVGESGCGKTTTAQAIAGLTDTTSGILCFSLQNLKRINFNWKTADTISKKLLRQKIQIIFQDPYSSLDPRMTVKSILEEPLIIHQTGNRNDRLSRIHELIAQVGLSPEYLDRYPHEFSGGQRQRIGIARALATNPEFIIADEPVSALDVSIQAQIINLMLDLRTDYQQTQLFISHDLAVVRHVANHIAVMYHGKIVEYGSESELFNNPIHPYTIQLLESVPAPGTGRRQKRTAQVEEPLPQVANPGCPFYQRCARRSTVCGEQIPELHSAGKTASVACFNIP